MGNEYKDSYMGNPHVKRDGVVHHYTQEEINEYIKCSQDPSYFARTYVKVIHLDRGLVPFKLYPYQEKMFNHFSENRFSIVLACRQSGKSISSVAYLLWYALFHSEKVIVILANKGATSREMLGRATLMLENIPFFLQPGCKSLNKGSIEFSNNSRIVTGSTSSSSIRGMSVNLLFLDEFAFVDNATEFYTSTYPVVTSGKDTKVIITSTANGIGNMFHKIWEGSQQKTNSYKPFRVDWWDVPGRDEAWKLETIANTSQLQFDQEFSNKFLGRGDTLIDAETLMGLRAIEPIERLEGDNLYIYKKPVENHNYLMFVDVSKGVGGDYSTFNIIDVSTQPFQQVARYRDNRISPILFPNIIHKYATAYNKAYVVIENNDQGMMVCNGLYHDLEYENMHVTSTLKNNGLGIAMDKKVKRLGCSGIKDILENSKLDIFDEQTIIECSTFEARGQSYEASNGNHDDLMMNLVMFGFFAGTTMFEEITDISLKQFVYKQRTEEIDADVPSFGYIDDGSEHMDLLEQKEREEDPFTNSWGTFGGGLEVKDW